MCCRGNFIHVAGRNVRISQAINMLICKVIFIAEVLFSGVKCEEEL